MRTRLTFLLFTGACTALLAFTSLAPTHGREGCQPPRMPAERSPWTATTSPAWSPGQRDRRPAYG